MSADVSANAGERGRAGGTLAAVLTGFLCALLFTASAMTLGRRIPLTIRFGEESRWGADRLVHATGGVRAIELSVGGRTINEVLGMPDGAKASWMRSTAPRVELDPDTGMPVSRPDAGPERPESWPFVGELGRGIYPAIFLAAPFGFAIEKKVVGDGTVMKLDPLLITLGPEPVFLLVFPFAALLAAAAGVRLFGRGFRSAESPNAFAAVAAVSAMLFAAAAAGAAFVRAMPRWNAEWLDYFAALRARGELQQTPVFTQENVIGLLATLSIFGASVFIAVRRARHFTKP